jgi:hypothetical protein
MVQDPERVIVTAPVVESTTAEEFLERFNVLRDHWQPDPTEWVFRGHGDSQWRLEPSAHRKGAWKEFLVAGKDEYDPTARPAKMQQGIAERNVLHLFHTALDRSGLAIPTDGELLREGLKRMHHNADEALPSELGPFVALARHAGLPTRVLDWTRRGKVACYFAAAKAARLLRDAKDGDKPTHLDVWALRLSFVERFGSEGGVPQFSILTAPQASNPNLHAQSGVCISQAYGSLAGHLASLDAIAQYVVDMMRPERRAVVPAPVFHRFTLLAKEAPKLLRLLSYEGITAGFMFPTPEGAVDSLREQSLWDEPPLMRGPMAKGF